MSRKLLAYLTFAVFVFAMGATSMADVWSQEKWGYGPSEGTDHTRMEESVPSGNNGAYDGTNGTSQAGAEQMQGPMETGSVPDGGLSGSEEGISRGQRTLNSDQINGAVPSENWDSFPHGRENLQAGD